MKNFLILIIIWVAILNIGCSKYINIKPKKIVEITNEIMGNIHQNIINIRNQSEQLNKYYIEDCFLKGRQRYPKEKCLGYCPPWKLAEIRAGAPTFLKQKDFFLNINFTPFRYNSGSDSISPTVAIYIPEIKHYLVAIIFMEDGTLKENIIDIIRQSIKK